MITAIYVYEPTTLSINTSEENLELATMGSSTTVPLNAYPSTNSLPVGRGIYKIASWGQAVSVSCGSSGTVLVDTAVSPKKPYPDFAPSGVLEQFTGVTLTQLQDFFVVAEGKTLPNP